MPSTAQNSMSCHASSQVPRSQNHWYECSSQVSAKTYRVAMMMALLVPRRFNANTAGK